MGTRRDRTTKPDQERADAWLLEARCLAARGVFSSYDAAEGITVAQFVHRWLEGEVKPTVRAITFVHYEQSFRRRIEPSPFGSLKLAKLTVANCQAWRARMTGGVLAPPSRARRYGCSSARLSRRSPGS